MGLGANVLLNFILISQWNACGAALASVASELIVLCVQTICVRDIIDWSVQRKDFFQALLSGGVMAFCITVLERKIFFIPSVSNTIILVVSGGIMYISIQILLKNETMLAVLKVLKRKLIKKGTDCEK